MTIEDRTQNAYEALETLTKESDSNSTYFSADRVYLLGKRKLWKKEKDMPTSRGEVAIFLDQCVERSCAEQVFADLGGNRTNIKLYRAIIKEQEDK